MRFYKFARVSFLAALGCATGGSRLLADEDLPAVHTLPCETACANSTGAMGLRQPLPTWPREFLESLETYVEGYVRLHYKINTDGHVSDISVIATVGPKEFEDRTLDTVKDWVYKPALLNGKPVATCHTLVMTFKMAGKHSSTPPGARTAIIMAYKTAVENIKNNKMDEALTVLTDALSKPRLNLYERGMLANATSAIAMQKGDYLEAHRASSVALAFSSSDLPAPVKQTLMETRIKSALLLGDLVDALDAQDRLKDMKAYDSADPLVRAVDQARAKANDMPLFSVTAKIPEVSQGESTYVGLYRRNFAFHDIKGSLTGFTLTCKQQAIESQISETAEWHVPKSWSDCRVLVRGAPGTTFKMAQLTD